MPSPALVVATKATHAAEAISDWDFMARNVPCPDFIAIFCPF